MKYFIIGFIAWIAVLFIFIFLWSHFKKEINEYDKEIGYDKDKEIDKQA